MANRSESDYSLGSSKSEASLHGDFESSYQSRSNLHHDMHFSNLE